MNHLLVWAHGAAAFCALAIELCGVTLADYCSSAVPRGIEETRFAELTVGPAWLEVLAFVIAMLPVLVFALVMLVSVFASVAIFVLVLASVAAIKASAKDKELIRQEIGYLRRLPVFGRMTSAVAKRMLPENGAHQ